MEKTQIASTIYIVAFSKLSQIVEEFLRNGGQADSTAENDKQQEVNHKLT